MKTLLDRAKIALLAFMVAMLLTGCTLLPTASSSVFNALEAESDTVTLPREEYERLQRYASLDELSRMVEDNFYQEPDMDAMLEGAKRGLLAGLGDPYTYYYSAEDFSQMWSDDKGEYAGVGIQISASYVTMLCTITRVFSGSPAEAAGLRKGDILSKVDTLDVSAVTLDEAVSIMRGEVGQPVDVQVLRNSELLDFTIPRDVVHVNWVSSTMLAENVAYLQLYDFAGDCSTRFYEQLNALLAQGARALIIDLRDNPGGWVDDAVNLADIFLPKEIVTYFEYRDGEKDYYYSNDGALEMPMVVLMNENSASASEILAGAFQDYGIATIVGTQSYGKGIAQFVLSVGDSGEGMQITAARYFTPSGRSVHQVGITPDVEATLPKGDTTLYALGDLNDPQLKVAYEVVLQKMAGTFTEQTVPAASDEAAKAPDEGTEPAASKPLPDTQTQVS